MQSYEIPNKLKWEETEKFSKLKYSTQGVFKTPNFQLAGIHEQILCQILGLVVIQKIDAEDWSNLDKYK